MHKTPNMSHSTSEPIFSYAKKAMEERRESFLEANNMELTKKTILPAALETRTVITWEPFQENQV